MSDWKLVGHKMALQNQGNWAGPSEKIRPPQDGTRKSGKLGMPICENWTATKHSWQMRSAVRNRGESNVASASMSRQSVQGKMGSDFTKSSAAPRCGGRRCGGICGVCGPTAECWYPVSAGAGCDMKTALLPFAGGKLSRLPFPFATRLGTGLNVRTVGKRLPVTLFTR